METEVKEPKWPKRGEDSKRLTVQYRDGYLVIGARIIINKKENLQGVKR